MRRRGTLLVALVVFASSLLTAACGRGAGLTQDESGCLRTMVADYERSTSEAEVLLERAAARLPGDARTQKEVAADLRRAAQHLSGARGGCL